ncbi:MAG: hypothetical protein H7335_10325 [Massilia sp.]|nr:hypothetical protein [Massilia sp.]
MDYFLSWLIAPLRLGRDAAKLAPRVMSGELFELGNRWWYVYLSGNGTGEEGRCSDGVFRLGVPILQLKIAF